MACAPSIRIRSTRICWPLLGQREWRRIHAPIGCHEEVRPNRSVSQKTGRPTNSGEGRVFRSSPLNFFRERPMRKQRRIGIVVALASIVHAAAAACGAQQQLSGLRGGKASPTTPTASPKFGREHTMGPTIVLVHGAWAGGKNEHDVTR